MNELLSGSSSQQVNSAQLSCIISLTPLFINRVKATLSAALFQPQLQTSSTYLSVVIFMFKRLLLKFIFTSINMLMVGPSILVKYAGYCNTLWGKPSQKNCQAVQLGCCTWNLPLFCILFHLIENLSWAFRSHVKKLGWFEIVKRDWSFLGSFQDKLNWLGVMDCSVTQQNSLLLREPVLTGLSGSVFRKNRQKASNCKRWGS